MVKCPFRISTLLLILLLVPFASVAGELVFRYELTTDKVDSASLDESGGRYHVRVNLKEPYRTDFAILTERVKGRRLKVIFEDGVVLDTVVRERADSGSILIEWGTIGEAKRFMDAVAGGG